MNLFPVHKNPRPPASVLARDALKQGTLERQSFWRQLLVVRILARGTDPQIRFAVVQGISVDMVNNYAPGRVQNDTVHVNSAPFPILFLLPHGPVFSVSFLSRVPLPLGKEFVIFVVHNRDQPLGQRYLAHGSLQKRKVGGLDDSPAHDMV